MKFAETLLNLLQKGYSVDSVTLAGTTVLMVRLEIPIEHKPLKRIHELFTNADGYCISMVYGECTFNEWEIYDDDEKFKGVERYKTLEEAIDKILYYMKAKKVGES